MATEAPLHYTAPRLDAFTPEDLETASIRSAAPSYISEAPSHQSVLPAYSRDCAPAYSRLDPHNSAGRSGRGRTTSQTPTYGLPRLPSPNRRGGMPSLGAFQMPQTWSTPTMNPCYARVAQRRAAAFASTPSLLSTISSSSLSSPSPAAPSPTETNSNNAMNNAPSHSGNAGAEDASHIVRPLEDPYLVGEEAATRARNIRLTRERGDDILQTEDRRWDWFLAQMRDWDERDRSWNVFRQDMESRNRRRFGRLLRR